MPERPSGPVGLYDPSYEHDACGVAMVAKLDGKPSHETVERAIVALENLEHRGAAGADPNTGDGAGILLQMPDELMRGVVGAELPAAGGGRSSPTTARMSSSGICSRIPAPSPVFGSAPAAPRCSRFSSATTARRTVSWVGLPSSRATKATPQASCS